ncbi:RidA family protein [Halodesulfovibrio sp.]|uniref:RidA family protein n=1 Tax=Halodesulfovibrio sp. TaxID=1912772 RepID=UPI0025DA8DB1|nr:RidA family protein [Halodesulfovibrio sp.]MCT4626522.1 RidA family protein [Halodesulfovibrio sp.]
MSEITRHSTGPRMSKATVFNGVAYLCGQVPDNTDCDICDQARNMLEKVDTLLKEVGSDRKHVLSVIVYLRDMKDFAGFNSVWDTWFESGFAPARACVEARLARPELLCEVSVQAAVIAE